MMLKYIGYGLLALILVLGGYYLIISQTDSSPRTNDIAVHGEFVNYFEGVEGYYAEPAEGRRYPGVVIVHEWWGLNDNIAGAAEELAAEGYRVLAVDLFEGEVAATTTNAQALVAAVDQGRAVANMKAAEQFLRDKGSSNVGVLGWCFGGGQALQLALSENEELDAMVIYYGTPLITDAGQLERIDWPLMAVFGDNDQAIPVATIDQFKQALADADVDNEVYVYPGVGHAFANPSNGVGYAPTEAADAWRKTLAFLEDNL
jgi:carboxymethylenebutenolidase